MKTECKTYARLLIDYADGERHEAEKAGVEDHVAQCSDCASALAEYRDSLNTVRGGLREVPEASAPLDLAKEIRSNIRNHRLAFATALCVVLIGFAVTVELAFRSQETNMVASNGHVELSVTAPRLDLPTKIVKVEEELSTLALIQYEEVAAILYAAGVNLEENVGSVEEALERYEHVVKYYPQTTSADKARNRTVHLKHRLETGRV